MISKKWKKKSVVQWILDHPELDTLKITNKED